MVIGRCKGDLGGATVASIMRRHWGMMRVIWEV